MKVVDQSHAGARWLTSWLRSGMVGGAGAGTNSGLPSAFLALRLFSCLLLSAFTVDRYAFVSFGHLLKVCVCYLFELTRASGEAGGSPEQGVEGLLISFVRMFFFVCFLLCVGVVFS